MVFQPHLEYSLIVLDQLSGSRINHDRHLSVLGLTSKHTDNSVLSSPHFEFKALFSNAVTLPLALSECFLSDHIPGNTLHCIISTREDATYSIFCQALLMAYRIDVMAYLTTLHKQLFYPGIAAATVTIRF